MKKAQIVLKKHESLRETRRLANEASQEAAEAKRACARAEERCNTGDKVLAIIKNIKLTRGLPRGTNRHKQVDTWHTSHKTNTHTPPSLETVL